VPILEAVSVDEILNEGWKFDPPKAISDVFEGVVGALLIDSGYDYDLVASVVENVMEDVLGGLSPRLRPDPTSELTEWMGKSGCRAFTFRYSIPQAEISVSL
jgi:endoribonuclease Dicer